MCLTKDYSDRWRFYHWSRPSLLSFSTHGLINMETLEQKRARYAWQCVLERRDIYSQRGIVKGLPLLLFNGGLYNLLHICTQRKNTKQSGMMLSNGYINDFLKDISSDSDYSRFMEQITKLDSRTFQLVTARSSCSVEVASSIR